ncbi:hypothetical protein Q3G72_019201 [Acer saccharum]|nr:hypothetical protein Q3G72_019201 [Acer saccharum]
MGTDSAILPEEYFEEIKDRGLIVNWCPQEKVLLHPAVSVFLTHWVEFYDRKHKHREVNYDVKHRDIENLVKDMEGEEGKKMRENALEWKKKAEAATDIGGKSKVILINSLRKLSIIGNESSTTSAFYHRKLCISILNKCVLPM